MKTILEVQNCSISYKNSVPAVRDVSFAVGEREIVTLVGESGSGKTTLIRAILGILPSGCKVTGGGIRFRDVDLTKLREEEYQQLRGTEIAMIFQDVGASLDPIRRIDGQYVESIRVHRHVRRGEALSIGKRMLSRMRLSDPDRVMASYPFELSGGMKQRVGIAMSMTAQPKLLLADEPTSALDVTIQAQVVEEMKQLREQYDAAIILVTHNMGVASYISDKIGVMQNGQMVEFGPRDEVIFHPAHDYTRRLLNAVPKLEGKRFAK